MKMEAVSLHIRLDELLDSEQVDMLLQISERLARHEPIQYITGSTDFFGLTLQLNPSVLIPRQETEELVAWIIESNKINKPAILDIGTGSGCIALALKNEITDASVFALDISTDALELANMNATRNGLKIHFIHDDILNIEKLHYTDDLDLIVSNPPYVLFSERDSMMKNVLDFEPKKALFVEDSDPLLFYRHISQLALTKLKPGGKLFFEINEQLGDEMIGLLNSYGFHKIVLKSDLFGKNRMISCEKVH